MQSSASGWLKNFHGRVERGKRQSSASAPSSNRACDFPAHGLQTSFISSIHKCHCFSMYRGNQTETVGQLFIRSIAIEFTSTLTFSCLALRYSFLWKSRTLGFFCRLLLFINLKILLSSKTLLELMPLGYFHVVLSWLSTLLWAYPTTLATSGHFVWPYSPDLGRKPVDKVLSGSYASFVMHAIPFYPE